jgi:hypothetical protein
MATLGFMYWKFHGCGQMALSRRLAGNSRGLGRMGTDRFPPSNDGYYDEGMAVH